MLALSPGTTSGRCQVSGRSTLPPCGAAGRVLGRGGTGPNVLLCGDGVCEMGIFWRGLNLGNGEMGGVADKGKIFFFFFFFCCCSFFLLW